MILAVDNGSSYTPALFESIRKAGAPCDFRAFDEVGEIGGYSHYILSGRRRNNRAMNAANASIIRHALDHGKPLLGICYGAEMLALVSGGTIRKMPELAKGFESVTTVRENPLCSGDVEVYESHAYEIARMPSPLIRLAGSAACKNEIIQYGGLNAFGTQFHPEMTREGREMVSNFLKM
ncbi:MAG: gamma-glutamyl-gamma-aminobutyrate hydrolase family protein [Nitrosopumilaceae archaeon]|nr:gamma-glutamyl-gamma-aminobutyrate hydrolase family protein [Nitrosopumilaceae archaeon]